MKAPRAASARGVAGQGVRSGRPCVYAAAAGGAGLIIGSGCGKVEWLFGWGVSCGVS